MVIHIIIKSLHSKNFSKNEIKLALIETFEGVKKIVRKSEGQSRAGLMLGFQELGSSLDGFIGAYYPSFST